jgi:hypothetical protein
MRRLKLRHLLIVLSCAAPLPARAQTAAPASASALAAETAFMDGVRLMKEGDCQQAARRFEESQRLDPASGTLLNLAYCQTQLGKTASAWLAYRQASALAERTGKASHAQLAREQGEKLEPLLPRLRFTFVGEVRRVAQLRLDDEEMAKESWALSWPVDPGPHRVSAVFDTGESWQGEVVARAGQQSVVEVKVPQAEAAKAASGASPAAAAASPAGAAPVRPVKAELPVVAKPPSDLALGLGVVGASAIAVGTALFVSARVGYDSARDHCSSGNVCPDTYYDREQSAQSRAKWSLVLGGGGLLMIGTAAVLHFGVSRSEKPRAALNAAVLGPRDFGAVYTRQF